MSKRHTFGMSLLTGLSVALLLGAQNSSAGQFVVKYRHQRALSTLNQMETQSAAAGGADIGLFFLENHAVGKVALVDIDDSKEISTLLQIFSDPSIEYVVPNFKLKTFTTPLEPSALKEQWAIAKVQAEKAWQRAGNRGSHSVTVAVIDTGADYNHESLAKNMVKGYDFKNNNDDPMDKTGAKNPGHGTHCSGIIGATGVAEGGTIGISPEVSLMPLRFLDENGSGSLMDGIKAIDYAIEKKVQVISASWGATVARSQAAPLIEAIKRADDAGVIFVAAAANDGKNNDETDVFPANAGTLNMISVAASGNQDEKPSWSNYGKATVSLASPGLAIMSTLPQNKYGNLSGTSMATPLVSGLVAFLKAQDPSLNGAQIRSILQTTGSKVSIETACNCRVDAFAAVDAVLNKKMVVVPAAASLPKDQTLQLMALYGKGPFKFVSSQPATMSVSDSGLVKAMGTGTATITITDSTGKSATSLDFNSGVKGTNPGNPGNPGEPTDPTKCPLGNQQLCDILCQLQPELPFCKK